MLSAWFCDAKTHDKYIICRIPASILSFRALTPDVIKTYKLNH
jgi:hypothetical protein